MRRRQFLAALLATPAACIGCRQSDLAGAGADAPATATRSSSAATDHHAAPAAATATPVVAPPIAAAAGAAQPMLAATTSGQAPAVGVTPTGRAATTSAGQPLPAATTTAGGGRPALRVAYLHEGDVFVLDTSTGARTRLAGGGIPGSLRWTGDWRALLYSTGAAAPPPAPFGAGAWPPGLMPTPTPPAPAAQTFRWEAAAAPRPVATGLWSPDGSVVAGEQPASADPNAGWVVWVERDGRRWTITPMEPGVRWQALAWSPDGRRLALARYTTVRDAVRPLPETATLWLTGADLTPRTPLPLPNPNGSMHSWPDLVRWSPDGQWLLLGVGPGQGCESCRADGLPLYALPASGGPAVAIGTALTDGAFAWSPGGAWLALSSGPTGRITYQSKQLSRFDWPAARSIALTNDPAWSAVEPAVSPDGRQVAFARGHGQRAGETTIAAITSRRLWLVGASGGAARQITSGDGWTDAAPAWSPHSGWLVFVRWRPAAKGAAAAAGLWAVRPDGSGLQAMAPALGAVKDFTTGFGFYGSFGWDRQFAVAPARP